MMRNLFRTSSFILIILLFFTISFAYLQWKERDKFARILSYDLMNDYNVLINSVRILKQDVNDLIEVQSFDNEMINSLIKYNYKIAEISQKYLQIADKLGRLKSNESQNLVSVTSVQIASYFEKMKRENKLKPDDIEKVKTLDKLYNFWLNDISKDLKISINEKNEFVGYKSLNDSGLIIDHDSWIKLLLDMEKTIHQLMNELVFVLYR